MLDNIFEAGCAGGVQFSLIDEWFKQTWIANPYSDRATRHFWHDITAPEQNFGILSFVPHPNPLPETGSFPGEAISRIAKPLPTTAFFRVRLYHGYRIISRRIPYGLHSIPMRQHLGESVLPNGSFHRDEAGHAEGRICFKHSHRGRKRQTFICDSLLRRIWHQETW